MIKSAPLLAYIAAPAGDSGWFDLALGLVTAALFGWSLWQAHQPGGGFRIGRTRNVRATRDDRPAMFWVMTVLQAAFCLGGLIAAFHGAAILFLWPPG